MLFGDLLFVTRFSLDVPPGGLAHTGVGVKPGTLAQGGRSWSLAFAAVVAPRFAGCVIADYNHEGGSCGK
jgi:hypothetical protein